MFRKFPEQQRPPANGPTKEDELPRRRVPSNPMSSQTDALDVSEARRVGSDEVCPICLSDMVDPAVLVPCRHKFCAACCTTLLRSSETQTMPCPVCRTPARLADVETVAGENLRQLQIRQRHGDTDALYFEVTVRVQTVQFGAILSARHPTNGEQALTPSARTPNLWEICDSCYFDVEAVASLPEGTFDAFVHVKRLGHFRCQKFVTLTMTVQDKSTSRTLPLDTLLTPNAWTMLPVATDVPGGGKLDLGLHADNRDWWKSGLIFDCLMVQPSRKKRRQRRSTSERRLSAGSSSSKRCLVS